MHFIATLFLYVSKTTNICNTCPKKTKKCHMAWLLKTLNLPGNIQSGHLNIKKNEPPIYEPPIINAYMSVFANGKEFVTGPAI